MVKSFHRHAGRSRTEEMGRWSSSLGRQNLCPGELQSESLGRSAPRMERAGAASEEDQAGAEFPTEPLENQVSILEQPQVPMEERRPKSTEDRPNPAVQEATGTGQDPSGGKKLPSPRPACPRVLPPSLGYGTFRRQASVGPEPPSPGPALAEQPGDGETPGAELVPRATTGEPAPGDWAPVELQVDVRVKPVGTASGSGAPSPASSTRFITVPVPDSPAFSRHLGSTWGRASPLVAARAERGLEPEGRASPAERRAESTGSPTCRCRCRCQEQNLEEEEDALMLRRAEVDKKLHRAITLIGLPMYIKSLRWALAIMAVLLAVSTVAIVALASRTGAKCQPCPWGWLWSGKHCYYFSAEGQAWEASQAFCKAHHATLPLLIHIQHFLNRYPVTMQSWVGAQRGPQGWNWIDGALLPPELFPEEAEDQPALKCGGLEGGKLVAVDCASSRPWACVMGSK